MPVSRSLPFSPSRLPGPVARLLTRARARDLSPILCYHAVGAVRNPLAGRGVHAVEPDLLRRQLAELRRFLRFVSVEEIAERAAAGRPLSGLAAVTFDDGYASVLNCGLPILEELEIPATLFVTTSLLEGGILWRDKVRYLLFTGLVEPFLAFAVGIDPRFQAISPRGFYRATKDPGRVGSRDLERRIDEFLAAEGIDLAPLAQGLYCRAEDLTAARSPLLRIGSHSHRHPLLATLSEAEVGEEIAAASGRLRALGIDESPLFAVPFGGLHTFGPSLVGPLRDLGYRGYLTISNRARPLDCRVGIDAAPGRESLVVLRRFMPRASDPWVLL